MANSLSNTKSLTKKSSAKSGANFAVRKISLINPNETLVKKEEKSIIVRNKDGKLVRRKDPDGVLPDIYNLIQEGEVFVREEETRIIVRNSAGKLVARKIIVEEVLDEETIPSFDTPTDRESKEEKQGVGEETQEESEVGGSLRDRLKSRHSFLDRIERGQKVGVAPENKDESTFHVVNADLVEEMDDKDILPDADVLELEDAVGGSGANVSSGAINPNEKPNLAGSGVSKGLVGNYALATPEKEVVIPQEKKEKKKRKPIKSWVVVVALVSIYVIGMLAYFFAAYNFNQKSVGIVLYYIDIGENAKLEYYDGEQFNYNEMKMTYYYSDEKIESFNLSGANFAETTIGMGYKFNNEYISALWIDNFASASSRVVKIKFSFDNLICYVPVTIYRNKLDKLEKLFTLSSLEAEQEIVPTVFGVYKNVLLEKRNEVIRKVLPLDSYDLELIDGGTIYSLKDHGCFDGTKYVLPAEIDADNDPTTPNVAIDYSSPNIRLCAVTQGDSFNDAKSLQLYPQSSS